MEIFKFEIPFQLPGQNEIIAAAKQSPHVYAQLKKTWMFTCMVYIRNASVPKYDSPIEISFHWIEPNDKRDLDNICAGAKFILDGLVVTERIRDDRPAFVKNLTHSFGVPDKKSPRVGVTIFRP